jgi:hypothetical protein
MANLYVIRLNVKPTLCLGVTSMTAGAKVMLTLLQGNGNKYNQWEIDPNSGVIALAADPQFVMDVAGSDPQDRTPIVLNLEAPDRPFQSWNWLSDRPFIHNNGAPKLVIDDTGNHVENTGVYVFQKVAGNVNQQFTFVSVASLRQHAAAPAAT